MNLHGRVSRHALRATQEDSGSIAESRKDEEREKESLVGQAKTDYNIFISVGQYSPKTGLFKANVQRPVMCGEGRRRM